MSDTVAFTTGDLPADLPSYQAGGSEPVSGLRGLRGECLRHRDRQHRPSGRGTAELPGGMTLNFQPQPTGTVPHPAGDRRRPATCSAMGWRSTPDGDDHPDTWAAPAASAPVPRCAWPSLTDAYWLMCDETRVMDLSGVGGVADANVTGTVVQHLDPAGGLLVRMDSSFDHFEITDLDLESRDPVRR